MEHLRSAHNGFNISNHTFLNAVSAGLTSEMQSVVPNLALAPTDKRDDGDVISVTLKGYVQLAPTDDRDAIDGKVRQLMDKLRNEHALLSLLE